MAWNIILESAAIIVAIMLVAEGLYYVFGSKGADEGEEQ